MKVMKVDAIFELMLMTIVSFIVCRMLSYVMSSKCWQWGDGNGFHSGFGLGLGIDMSCVLFSQILLYV
jgi:hypothetical protein